MFIVHKFGLMGAVFETKKEHHTNFVKTIKIVIEKLSDSHATTAAPCALYKIYNSLLFVTCIRRV